MTRGSVMVRKRACSPSSPTTPTTNVHSAVAPATARTSVRATSASAIDRRRRTSRHALVWPKANANRVRLTMVIENRLSTVRFP